MSNLPGEDASYDRRKALAEVSIVALFGRKPGDVSYDKDIDELDEDDRRKIKEYCGIGYNEDDDVEKDKQVHPMISH